MAKFNVPARPRVKRKYQEGNRKTVSVRLPQELMDRLAKECKAKGYTQTEIIEIVLDQYFQYEDKK